MKKKKKKSFLPGLIVALVFIGVIVVVVIAGKPSKAGTCTLADGTVNPTGFDEYGYNKCAHQFVGTGWSWCMAKVGNEAWCTSYLGSYANDKLVMKWNEEWDRGNAEGWNSPPYEAWENNEWNGASQEGSGAVWHYKIKWVGPCGGEQITLLPDGSYCIWGEFAMLMDQGVDPNIAPGHIWVAHGIPTGYGA